MNKYEKIAAGVIAVLAVLSAVVGAVTILTLPGIGEPEGKRVSAHLRKEQGGDPYLTVERTGRVVNRVIFRPTILIDGRGEITQIRVEGNEVIVEVSPL